MCRQYLFVDQVNKREGGRQVVAFTYVQYISITCLYLLTIKFAFLRLLNTLKAKKIIIFIFGVKTLNSEKPT